MQVIVELPTQGCVGSSKLGYWEEREREELNSRDGKCWQNARAAWARGIQEASLNVKKPCIATICLGIIHLFSLCSVACSLPGCVPDRKFFQHLEFFLGGLSKCCVLRTHFISKDEPLIWSVQFPFVMLARPSWWALACLSNYARRSRPRSLCFACVCHQWVSSWCVQARQTRFTSVCLPVSLCVGFRLLRYPWGDSRENLEE